MSFTLRAATAADSAVVARLVHEDAVHYYGDRAPPLAATVAAMGAERFGPAATCETVVGCVDDIVVAFATYSVFYPANDLGLQLFMKELYVTADARGHGVGESMMRGLAGIAVSRGCVRFDWTTETSNPAGMRFYERLGAQAVEDKIYYRLAGPALATVAEGIES